MTDAKINMTTFLRTFKSWSPEKRQQALSRFQEANEKLSTAGVAGSKAKKTVRKAKATFGRGAKVVKGNKITQQ